MTGRGSDFIRELSQPVFGIPREQVICRAPEGWTTIRMDLATPSEFVSFTEQE